VYNFMHGIGTDLSISEWFDFRVPKVSMKKNYVDEAIRERSGGEEDQLNSRILWTGNRPQYVREVPMKKGKGPGKSRFFFYNRTETFSLIISTEMGDWLNALFERFLIEDQELLPLEELKKDYEKHFSTSFASFLRSREWKRLREKGLLLI